MSDTDIAASAAYICICIIGCTLMLAVKPWIVLSFMVTPSLIAVYIAANWPAFWGTAEHHPDTNQQRQP